MRFDDQPILSDGVMRLRGLVATDLAGLREAAADKQIWEGHPKKDRYLPDVFDPYFEFLLGAGGALIVQEAASRAVIGCSRYYVGPDAPGDISIGFTFLVRAHWGGATNWRMKSLMLDHAFQSFDRVWFHIAEDNVRSQKATEKLGARLFEAEKVELAGTPGKLLAYCLHKADWARRRR